MQGVVRSGGGAQVMLERRHCARKCTQDTQHAVLGEVNDATGKTRA